jgi:hypothetical protein
MKRDWDVVRKILLALEEQEGANSQLGSLDDVDDESFGYHVKLMKDAGLLEAAVMTPLNGPILAVALRMTWEGHEFLDSIRPKSTWDKVKEQAKEKGVSLSVDAIKFLAKAAMDAALKG